MNNPQKPIVGIGTEFPAGKVVAIKGNGVDLDTQEGIKTFSFAQIEQMTKQAISNS